MLGTLEQFTNIMIILKALYPDQMGTPKLTKSILKKKTKNFFLVTVTGILEQYDMM